MPRPSRTRRSTCSSPAPLGSQAANVAALVLTAIANTAANRAFTFGVRGRTHALRHQGQGLVVFALAWALTSGSLALLSLAAPDAPRSVELAVLVVANLGATVLRFLLLRGWVFGARQPAAAIATQHREPGARLGSEAAHDDALPTVEVQQR